MEAGLRNIEIGQFGNKITSPLTPKLPGFDAVNENKQVAFVNGSSPDSRVGPGIVLKVMAGDKISANTYAWYQPGGDKTVDAQAPMGASLLSQFINGAINAGKAVVSNTDFNFVGPLLTAFMNSQPNNQAAPKAYLNWILLDEEKLSMVQGSSNATQVPLITSGPKVAVLANSGNDIEIPKNGYIYIYVSNESRQNVYFDDLTIRHTKGPLSEETHYYPFGLVMSGISSKALNNTPTNRIKYSGKEEQRQEFSDGSGLEWTDFGARMYDNQIGRWMNIDPKASDAPGWSPYRAFFCNPIRYSDPDGQWEWDKVGNLSAQKGDNSYSMAKFLGTSQSNAMQMLNRGGVTANAKGVLNLKEGQSFAKDNLWVGTKSGSGPVVNNSKEATAHYYNGKGAAADVGDKSTTELLSSNKFQTTLTKITSQAVEPTGYFNVDLTKSTFHIGHTNVDYSVTNNGSSSAVTLTLFSRDGYWDPNFAAEKTLGKYFDRYKPDGKGPNLEAGGIPYDYKTRERTIFFKPVEEKK